MTPGKQETVSERVPKLQPVAALTRFHPDLSGLSRHTGEQADYVRQGVKMGTARVLLPFLEKVEIIGLESVCPIPNTPMWFMGIINNRGNLLPVFDLKLFMEMEVGQPSRWLMILGGGTRAVGLCIDSLPVALENPQQVELDQIEAQTDIPAALRLYVANAYMHDGALWTDLSYDKLFLDLGTRF